MKKVLFLSLVCSLLFACGGETTFSTATSEPVGQRTPKDTLNAKAFASCQAYQEYVVAGLSDYFLQDYGNCWNCVGILENGREFDAVADAAENTTATAPDNVSQTNTQETGVDEADIVETDSQGNLYILHGNELIIVDGFPAATMQQMASLPLAATGQAHGMYLDEAAKQLVIFVATAQRQYAVSEPEANPTGNNASNSTFIAEPAAAGTAVVFVDVANLTAPAVTHWLWFEGHYSDSRRIDGRVHLATRFPLNIPPALYQNPEFYKWVDQYHQATQEGADNLAAQAELEIRAAIAAVVQPPNGMNIVPQRVIGLTGAAAVAGVACSDIYHPTVSQYPGLMVLSSFSTTGQNVAATAITNNAYIAYASTAHFYLAQTSGGWWWGDTQTAETVVYKFAIGSSAPRYLSFGSVDGWASNRYQYSEHDNHLRIATSQNGLDPELDERRQQNHLFVLNERMQEVASVRGFGLDETIFSTRFVGDRGYVVTFRQTDPLFTFDLSEPTEPKLVGELEIPGFSTYMQPVGDTHLLTIGRAGDAAGNISGLQLQLFDVTNLSDPILVDRFTPDFGAGYHYSLAEYEPHAFTFMPAASVAASVAASATAGILSVPVVQYQQEQSFSGFLTVNVDLQSGLSEKGRTNHAAIAGRQSCEFEMPCAAPVAGINPLRTIIMTQAEQAYLFTLSNALLNASTATEPASSIQSIRLPSLQTLTNPPVDNFEVR